MADVNELTTATLAVAEVCSSTTDYVCSAFDSYKKLPREIRSIVNDLNSLHTSLLQLETVLRAVGSSSSLNKSASRSTKRLVDRCQQTFSQLVQLFGRDDHHEPENYLDNSHADQGNDFLEVARNLKQHNEDLGALIVGLGREIPHSNGYQRPTEQRETFLHDIPTPPPEYQPRASSEADDTRVEDEPASSVNSGRSKRSKRSKRNDNEPMFNITINLDIPSSPPRSSGSAYGSAAGDHESSRPIEALPAPPETARDLALRQLNGEDDYSHRSREPETRHHNHYDNSYPAHLPGEFPATDEDDLLDPSPAHAPYLQYPPRHNYDEERYFYPVTANGTHAPYPPADYTPPGGPRRQRSARSRDGSRSRRPQGPSYRVEDVLPHDYRSRRHNKFHRFDPSQYEQPRATEKQLQPYDGNRREDEGNHSQRERVPLMLDYAPEQSKEQRPVPARIHTISTDISERQPGEERPNPSRLNTVSTTTSYRHPEVHEEPEARLEPNGEPHNAGEAAQYLAHEETEDDSANQNASQDQPDNVTITITHRTTSTEQVPRAQPETTGNPSVQTKHDTVPEETPDHSDTGGVPIAPKAPVMELVHMPEERPKTPQTPVVLHDARTESRDYLNLPVERPEHEATPAASEYEDGSVAEKKTRRRRPKGKHTRDGAEQEYYDSYSDSQSRSRPSKSRDGSRPGHRRRRTRRSNHHTEVSYSENNVTLNNIHLAPYPSPPPTATATSGTDTPRSMHVSETDNVPRPLQNAETAIPVVPPVPTAEPYVFPEQEVSAPIVEPIQIRRMPIESSHEKVRRRKKNPPKKLTTCGIFKNWFKGCCCGA